VNAIRVLGQMVKADFKERARRTSFLVTLAFTVYVGYETFAGGIVINLDKYRGVYNSAWVGALMAAVTSCFLSLVGFYIVKGSIERDEQTRVGRILAATPMTKAFYTVAKALGNFAVLSSMVAVMAVAAVLMQLLRGEDRVVHLWALLGPLVLIALPVMAFVAALAVLFETLPVLRGGVGNVVWFFAWMALLVAGAPPAAGNGPHYAARVEFADFTGLGTIFSSTRETMLKINPKFTDSFSFNIGGMRPTEKFVWNGIDWTAARIAGRLEWAVIALLGALLAAVFFHRFDPARAGLARRRKNPEAPAAGEQGVVQEVAGFGGAAAAWSGMLTPLARIGGRTRFGHLVVAELRLMLQVSRGGGGEPRWRAYGKEMFYLSPTGMLIAVPVTLGDTFASGAPAPLFQVRGRAPISSTDLFTYDVTRDGQRFLVNEYLKPPHNAPLVIIQNALAEPPK